MRSALCWKEFATYELIGMEAKTVRNLFLAENSIIGTGAFLLGSLVGTGLSGLLNQVVKNIFEVPHTYQVSFSLQAWAVTFLFFALMYGFGMLRAAKIIRHQKVIDLLYDNRKNEEYRFKSCSRSLLVVLLSIAAMVAGVILLGRMLQTQTNEAFLYLGGACLLILVGVYELHRQIPLLLHRFAKQNLRHKYKEENLFFLGQIGRRIHSAGRTMAVVAILLTISLATMFVGLTMGAGYKANMKGKCFLKIFYHCDKDLSLRSEGHLLGFDEILLENEDSRNQKTLAMWSDAPSNSTITVQETDRHLTLRGKNFTYNFNKLTGLFAAMQYEDAVLLDKEMEFNIWRAPTDNDRKLKLNWLAARYDHCMTNAYRTEYQVTDSGVTLRAKVGIAPISLQKFLDLDVCWTVSNSGAVTLALHAERNTVFPELPRFGLRLFLPKEMARVSYFGMGPMESYCDKHHAASHGYFSSTIWQQHEDYIRPQENGSHYDCDYVQLDGAGIKLTAVGAKPFCFNASHYTQEELTEKAHNYELHPCDSTVLCLDYAQNGIGSASCGPRLAEQYRLDDASFDFSIRLIPEKA